MTWRPVAVAGGGVVSPPEERRAPGPRVLLLTQSTNPASGSGVYAHRVWEALVARGADAQLVPLSESLPAGELAQLGDSIAALDPDVIHVLQCRPRHQLRLSRLRRGRPLVLTIHNLPPQECKIGFGYGWQSGYLLARNTAYLPAAAAVRAALRIAPPDAVVCDSQPVGRRVAEIVPRGLPVFQCPLGPSRGDVSSQLGLHEPFRSRNGGPPPSVRRIVTVSPFIYHKGVHRLVPVLAKLKRDGAACRLDVLGRLRDSRYLDFVRGLIARHRVDDTVTLFPDAADGDIEDALQHADIYVQPSLEEGFCLTFLDAALRVPCVIGTDVGAMPEIAALRGASASCVPRDSEAALEDAIRLHLSQAAPPIAPGVREGLGARFSWSAAAGALLRIYELVLEARGVRQ